MAEFIGRATQISELDKMLSKVRADTSSKPGRALIMHGRRRVGKSRLAEEFLERSGGPGVFFAASKQTTQQELGHFAQAVLESNIPGKEDFNGLSFGSWESALKNLARILPGEQGTVIIIDELPYLIESDPAFEGTLQKIFDRELSSKKVLLILIGSDLAMMEALNDYGRPFHQRASEMSIPPLSPAEVADMLKLNSADALDAYLITGGLPLVCQEWVAGMSMSDFLRESFNSSTSALIVSGERSLAAEFPPTAQARDVLGAIGSGERTFTNIGRAAGGLTQTAINRGLVILKDKRVVVGESPLSATKSNDTRYRIADTYLRFWLKFVAPNIQEIERGRGDRALERVGTAWGTWRGSAIEPVIRGSIERIPNPNVSGASPVVGSFWTRSNEPEIDLVVADRSPIANRVFEVGSIKWREQASFDSRDMKDLVGQRLQLPGADASTPLLVVSRTGFSVPRTTNLRMLGPDDLIGAWR